MALNPLEQFHQACNGAFEGYVIQTSDRHALDPAYFASDRTACLIINSIGSWLAKMAAGQQHPLCLNCDTQFSTKTPPLAFAVAIPFAAASTTQTLTSGICERCVTEAGDNLLALAIKCWRKVWHDAEVFPLSDNKCH